MDKEKDGDLVLKLNDINYVVDSKSSDMIKKSGNVTLDYIDGDGYGSGFTVNFGLTPEENCGDSCGGCGH
ncbi:MAG: hypothetical protein CR982_07875 [Candidatus Cloacimonadota bacterium]|nr:MAG: hypothetical protein CR982_07875 [Candidatus Cloacimonadota bacterium]PIE78227.1 MAG: hypothetical protein CSA15_08665 [Candidatus Delongbacteria bacterium]